MLVNNATGICLQVDNDDVFALQAEFCSARECYDPGNRWT